MRDDYDDPEYVNVYRLSDRVGLPHVWLRNAADEGKLPHIRIGKQRYFNVSAVLYALGEIAREATDMFSTEPPPEARQRAG